jgi:OmpA-OmpF porin, OOP family
MQVNLLDIIKSQIGGELIEKAANFVGEEGSVTKKALELIMPSILGGITQQAKEPINAEALLNNIKGGGHDGSIFDTVGNLLGGGSATQGFLDSGESIVDGLFGNKTSGIVDWIAAFTGIKTGSASGLMNMIAPLVMGAIGKQVVGGNLGVSGLTSLLDGQSSIIQKALPAGLSSVLGLTDLAKGGPSVFSTQKAIPPPESAFQAMSEKSFMDKILPWGIMLVAGIIGLMFLRTCKSVTPEPPTVIAVPEAKPEVAPANLADTVTIIKLPDGDIQVEKGSFLDKLNTEATDNSLDSTKALTFDNVNFATGSAIITDSSKTQLSDLVKIMKAYPKVAIKIEGHTDNVGNPVSNKKLSLNRAKSVMAFLQTNGVDAARLAVSGLGSDKPVAENTTEKGRAVNRRIEAYVVKK